MRKDSETLKQNDAGIAEPIQKHWDGYTVKHPISGSLIYDGRLSTQLTKAGVNTLKNIVSLPSKITVGIASLFSMVMIPVTYAASKFPVATHYFKGIKQQGDNQTPTTYKVGLALEPSVGDYSSSYLDAIRSLKTPHTCDVMLVPQNETHVHLNWQELTKFKYHLNDTDIVAAELWSDGPYDYVFECISSLLNNATKIYQNAIDEPKPDHDRTTAYIVAGLLGGISVILIFSYGGVICYQEKYRTFEAQPATSPNEQSNLLRSVVDSQYTNINSSESRGEDFQVVVDAQQLSKPPARTKPPTHTERLEKLFIKDPSKKEGFREDFVCPILQTGIMDEPVTASDGFTYEKEAIIQVIQTTGISPLTREKLRPDVLIPNRKLNSAVEEFIQKFESPALERRYSLT